MLNLVVRILYISIYSIETPDLEMSIIVLPVLGSNTVCCIVRLLRMT